MFRFLLLAATCALAADDLRISPDSLRGHLSFIASDLLEGRATPSRGLDIASEYIAAQFRRAGLEPIGDDGYFQTATLTIRDRNPQNFSVVVSAAGKSIHVDPSQAFFFTDKPLQIDNSPIIAADDILTPEQVAGKVVLITGRKAIGIHGAALMILSLRNAPPPAIYDPEVRKIPLTQNGIFSPEVERLVKDGPDARITLHVEPAIERTGKTRNVAGVLRGSDPTLRDTYVLLTAHYDHLGTLPSGDDKVFNGANDDGSGTVSVIEIASAIAAMNPRPKRSIVFMTFFGEELGLVGSQYYARHPLVPLDHTVADLNLEQVGRTDDTDGPQIAEASVTGFTYSSLTQTLVAAGAEAGVKIYNRPETDQYFVQSDNLGFAQAGVPAHTLGVAFEFPDYHKPGDEWQKIDYDNMAKIDRAVALGLLRLASEAEPPKWDESVAGAKKFAEAAKKLYGH